MEKKEWLVAYIKMHHEKKMRDEMLEKGIECFLPVQKEIHQWSDRKKKVERLIISMMIFVHVLPEERLEVLKLTSVSRYLVLHGENKPAVIRNSEMQQFMFIINNADKAVEISKNSLIPGEKVEVTKGPLNGLKGELITVNGKKKIAVRIEGLGCATVEMSIDMIKKCESVSLTTPHKYHINTT